MFNFAYQLELLLTAAKPPLYLSEMTINKQGPRYVRLEGKPGGWLLRKLLSLIGLVTAPRTVEVYGDRIENSLDSKWFQSKDKITFSTICSTGYQFFRFPHFLILAWLCFIYGVLSLIPLFNSENGDVAIMSIVICIALFVAGFIFLWLYFKVQRFIIYAYTNCGKGVLFAFQPRKSFIFAPADAIDVTLEKVNAMMELLSSLIDASKSTKYSPAPGFPQTASPRLTQRVPSNQSAAKETKTSDFSRQTGGEQKGKTASEPNAVPLQEEDKRDSGDEADLSLADKELTHDPWSAQFQEPCIDEAKSEEYLKKCLEESVKIQNSFLGTTASCTDINELIGIKAPLTKSDNFQKAIRYATPERKIKLLDIQNAQTERLKKEKMKCLIFGAIVFVIVLVVVINLIRIIAK